MNFPGQLRPTSGGFVYSLFFTLEIQATPLILALYPTDALRADNNLWWVHCCPLFEGATQLKATLGKPE